MRQKSGTRQRHGEKVVEDIRRATRKQGSAEEKKNRITLDGLKGEDSIADLCHREGIAQSLDYRWSKEFIGAERKRLAGGTAREATSNEVKGSRREGRGLKEVVVEQSLELRLLKKACSRMGQRRMRYPAPKKQESIRHVEGSYPPTKRTLDSMGVPRVALSSWWNRYRTGCSEAF